MLSLSRTPRTPIGVLAIIGVVGAIAACSSSNGAQGGSRFCTPGAYVYCRCEDRSEGTKLCHEDGQGFDACKCDGSMGPGDIPPDPNGGLEKVESNAPKIDARCAGKLGVVAGAEDDSLTYMLAYKGDGNFDASSDSRGMHSNADVAAVSSNLIATYAGPRGAILFTKMSSGAWSPPHTPFSQLAASAPALVAFGGGAHVFFLGQDDKFHMGTFGDLGWDDGTALGESSTAGAGSIPGKSAPAAAAINTSVTVTFTGSDGTLARHTYSGPWSGVTKFPSTTTARSGSQPAIVALEAGASKDYVMVFTDPDGVLRSMARSASSHQWRAASPVDAAAVTASAKSETTLVAMAGGKAMLIYRGTNNQAYYAIYDDAASGFSTPKPIASNAPELAGVPAATRGYCGAEISIAYAKKDGGVEIMRYANGSWLGPYPVGGITKATYVGIGEVP